MRNVLGLWFRIKIRLYTCAHTTHAYAARQLSMLRTLHSAHCSSVYKSVERA